MMKVKTKNRTNTAVAIGLVVFSGITMLAVLMSASQMVKLRTPEKKSQTSTSDVATAPIITSSDPNNLYCEGNFDCNQTVDGKDMFIFKQNLGRGPANYACTNILPCQGDFDCDGDVDEIEQGVITLDYGRSSLNNPCPGCEGQKVCNYPNTYCEANLDCDRDVDGTDAHIFKNQEFGRSSLKNPCTNSNPCKADYDCDGDVDGQDTFVFEKAHKEDFGRGAAGKSPCPGCDGRRICVYQQ